MAVIRHASTGGFGNVHTIPQMDQRLLWVSVETSLHTLLHNVHERRCPSPFNGSNIFAYQREKIAIWHASGTVEQSQ